MANTFSVNTYSPSEVVFEIGGYQLSGWDTMAVVRRVQSFTPVAGIRGKNTRVPSRDTSATITISLIQTSPSNDVLSRIHQLDIERGTGRMTILLKDNSGRSVFSSDEAYITGYPEVTFSGDFEMRTWSIFCQKTQSFTVGGNTRPETSLVDSLISGVSSAIGNIF